MGRTLAATAAGLPATFPASALANETGINSHAAVAGNHAVGLTASTLSAHQSAANGQLRGIDIAESSAIPEPAALGRVAVAGVGILLRIAPHTQTGVIT